MIHIEEYLPALKFNPDQPKYLPDKTIFAPENLSAGKYTIVFHEVSAKFQLDPLDSMILSTIWSLSRKHGYCYMSKGNLAKLLITTDSTLYVHLKKLKNMKLIENFKGIKEKLILTPIAIQAVVQAQAKIKPKKNRMTNILI